MLALRRQSNRKRTWHVIAASKRRCARDWLNDPAGADIPDLDSLQADACGPGYHYDSNQRLRLESKERMRSRVTGGWMSC